MFLFDLNYLKDGKDMAQAIEIQISYENFRYG